MTVPEATPGFGMTVTPHAMYLSRVETVRGPSSRLIVPSEPTGTIAPPSERT